MMIFMFNSYHYFLLTTKDRCFRKSWCTIDVWKCIHIWMNILLFIQAYNESCAEILSLGVKLKQCPYRKNGLLWTRGGYSRAAFLTYCSLPLHRFWCWLFPRSYAPFVKKMCNKIQASSFNCCNALYLLILVCIKKYNNLSSKLIYPSCYYH